MSERDKNEMGDQLDKLLDNLLSEEDQQKVMESSDMDFIDSQIKLQQKIDESLIRSFEFEPARGTEFHGAIPKPVQADVRNWWRRPVSVRWAIAASLFLAAALLIWSISGKGNATVYQRVPLAKLYHDTIDRGFKPYYNCEDQERFAAVFRQRQGRPLRLASLPDGHSMLGLSYMGGIGRNATAMLGKVMGENVIVFVDRVENDHPAIRDEAFTEYPANIFREVRHGLVFYEVSPLTEPKMIQFFQLEPNHDLSE